MASLWLENSIHSPSPALEGSVKTDVLVIGGGIAGILIAHRLKSAGVSCIVAEKDSVCGKTSGNTTAKITSQHGLIYQKLLKDIGKEKAQLYYRLNQSAIESFCTLSENYPCDFEKKDNFIYTADSRTKIYAELEALNEIGADAELFDSLPLPVDIAGAVCFPNQAQFNPVMLIRALAKELTVYENTAVKSVKGKTAYTDKGKITAEKIIVATHFPFIDRHGLFFMKMFQHRSYVIALENAPQLDGMYLEDKDDGFSFRNYGNLLFIGGGDHRTGKKNGGYSILRKKAEEWYPEAKEKYAWATQDCMTLDSMPYVGQYSKNTAGLYVATGFNKWGMTSSMVAADLLCARLLGKKHPAEELLSPSRSMLHPQLLINGFDFAASLLTPVPKRCTHMGCALKFNKAEKTWDCSCHGSRFGEDGTVLDGPAIRNQ